MNVDNGPIRLISSEGNYIEIDYKSAKRSKFVEDFIKDFPEAEIQLDEINYETLLKIKEFLEHYKNEEPKEIIQPLPKKDFKDCIDGWDYEYINISNEKVFEIMLAANFLDIQSLLDLTSAKIAFVIKGKNEEEIRKLFNMDKVEKEFNEENNIEKRQIDKVCEINFDKRTILYL